MKETIPWSFIHVPEVSGYFPGKDLKVFQLPGFRFSVTICWENLFPDLVRGFTKKGAQFIINITNEAWFGKSQASNHFVASSVFRAVENRIYVVRCANTGVSCFIDPYGKIVDRVRDEAGQDTFVRGVLCERVIPVESGTIYTHRGDLIVWLSSIVVGAFTLVGFLRRKGASPGRTQNH
jgi:apolipoprotein N-acyltransferase